MRTRLATALLAATASLALAAPAHADQQVAKDATQDVVRGEDQKPAKANKTTDITTFTTRLNKDSLKLSTTLRALPKDEYGVVYAIKTPKARYDVVLFNASGQQDFQLVRGTNEVPCEAKKTSTSAAKRTISVTIPRSCLRSPSSVQTGNGVITDLFGEGYVDDARRDGRVTGELKLGAKVRV